MKVNKVKLEKAIKSFKHHGSNITAYHGHNHDSCIFMSRIAVSYFKKLGFKAKMIEAHFLLDGRDGNIVNSIKCCSRYIKANNTLWSPPKRVMTQEEIKLSELIKKDVSGLLGHMVVVVEDMYLLDSSFGQFKLPEADNILYFPLDYESELYPNYGELSYPKDFDTKPIHKPLDYYDFKLKCLKIGYTADGTYLEYFSIPDGEELPEEEKNSSAWIGSVQHVVRTLVKQFKKEVSNGKL